MKQILKTIVLLATLTACSKQEFYEPPVMPGTDTPIEEPTRLTVLTNQEESSVTEGITVYLLTAENTQAVASFSSGQTVDVEAGKYIILKANTPWKGAELKGAVVTLATSEAASDEASSRSTGLMVASAPDIHAAHEYVDLKADDHHKHELTMKHYTRTVRLSLNLHGPDADKVQSVDYYLSDVRTGINLVKPFGNDASTGKATLTGTLPVPVATEDGTYTTMADVRLVGIDLEKPELTMDITLKDGTVQQVAANVSSQLYRFYSIPGEECLSLNFTLQIGEYPKPPTPEQPAPKPEEPDDDPEPEQPGDDPEPETPDDEPEEPEEEPAVAVTGVSLDVTAKTVWPGETFQLTATVAPADATDSSVMWSTSDKAVATVDANGKVTAVGPGTATITVTTNDGAKTATCAIAVNTPVTGVTLKATAGTYTYNQTDKVYEMYEGDTITFTATVAPDTATNKDISWSSEKTGTATVAGGVVTAVQAGTTTITVKTSDGDYTATATVRVKAKGSMGTENENMGEGTGGGAIEW